jgi:hypothetical protein
MGLKPNLIKSDGSIISEGGCESKTDSKYPHEIIGENTPIPKADSGYNELPYGDGHPPYHAIGAGFEPKETPYGDGGPPYYGVKDSIDLVGEDYLDFEDGGFEI